MKEITVHHPLASHADIGKIKIDEYGAAAIYRFLLSLGATKDIKIIYDCGGQVYAQKRIRYKSPMMPTVDDNGDRVGVQLIPLTDYIKILVKFHRAKTDKINKISGAMQRIQNSLELLKKELQDK